MRVSPLAGVRVLDLSTMFAGAAAAAWLADFGAEVTKIEHPAGDPARRLTRRPEDPAWWQVLNRNKRVVALRLSVEEGAAALKGLVANGADVIIEGFRPGTMERWGLGYDHLRDLEPRLIMTRVSGFGQQGALASRPAYGTLLEAFSGLAMACGTEGEPPVLPPYGLGDHITGLFAAFGTALAVIERARSGLGQLVDVSISESITQFMGPLVASAAATGQAPPRTGNRSSSGAPRNSYRAADGWVAIAAATDRLFEALANGMGAPELARDDRFRTNAARVDHVDVLDEIIGGWTMTRSRAEIVRVLSASGAPVAAVNDVAQFAADHDVQDRGSIVRVPGVEDEDSVSMPRPAPLMSATPGTHWSTGRPIGWDSEPVFREQLGMSDQEIDRLRGEGTIA